MEAPDVRLKSNGAYWQATYKDRDGKQRNKSLGPKANLSERQALARCRQLAVELATGEFRPKSDREMRLSEWLVRYPKLRTDLSPGTLLEVEQTGRYLSAFFTNDPPIDRISRLDAAEWRAALARGELHTAGRHVKPDDQVKPLTRVQPYRRKRAAELESGLRPPAAATVAKHVRTAKRMFNEAGPAGLELIRTNPFGRLSGRAPKARRTWRQVTPADLTRVLDACPDNAWRAAFALSRLAGLRRGECLRLQWQDIDWAGNRINVNARLDWETTKQSTRVLPIEPPRCRTGLIPLLRRWQAEAGDGVPEACPGIPATSVDSTARSILRQSGVGRYAKPFHTLRKCRAVEVASQYPEHVLCEWMGHSPEVAHEFYLRVDSDLFALPSDGDGTAGPS